MDDNVRISKIIQGIAAERNRGRIHNNKLQNGGRSIKVIGWNKSDYQLAQHRLERAGFFVKTVTTPGGAWTDPATRLHVK